MDQQQAKQALKLIDRSKDKDVVSMMIEDIIVDLLQRITDTNVETRKADEFVACLLIIRVAKIKHDMLMQYTNGNEIVASYLIALTIVIFMRGSKYQDDDGEPGTVDREKIEEILASFFASCPCIDA